MYTILLVEDDSDVLHTLEATLAQAGNRVIAVSDATAALSLINGGTTADLVVTDYKLPGMDGMELLSELRKLAPSLPVVVLTGYSSVESYLKFINLGAFEYINKPVLSRELKRIVRAALLNGAPADRDPKCCGEARSPQR